MKQLTVFMLVLIMILTLSACGNQNPTLTTFQDQSLHEFHSTVTENLEILEYVLDVPPFEEAPVPDAVGSDQCFVSAISRSLSITVLVYDGYETIRVDYDLTDLTDTQIFAGVFDFAYIVEAVILSVDESADLSTFVSEMTAPPEEGEVWRETMYHDLTYVYCEDDTSMYVIISGS